MQQTPAATNRGQGACITLALVAKQPSAGATGQGTDTNRSLDSAERDSAERDSAERDSAERDSNNVRAEFCESAYEQHHRNPSVWVSHFIVL
jgi:hypothetical protein